VLLVALDVVGAAQEVTKLSIDARAVTPGVVPVVNCATGTQIGVAGTLKGDVQRLMRQPTNPATTQSYLLPPGVLRARRLSSRGKGSSGHGNRNGTEGKVEVRLVHAKLKSEPSLNLFLFGQKSEL
jgi:hypothetical protein